MALVMPPSIGHLNAAKYWPRSGSSRALPRPAHSGTRRMGLKMAVHGDDFVTEGCEESLRWLEAQLSKHFEIKTEILGGAPHLLKTCTLLNRVIEWTTQGLTWEPDPRHAELVVEHLGLKGGKGAVTPGVKEHSRRRGNQAEGDSGLEAIDHLQDCPVGKGDEMYVREHGRAVVHGVGCCGFPGLVGVDY